MQIYETVIVVHPRLSDGEIAEFSDSIKKQITKGSGEILSEDKWGRRKLAYPINRSREGYYLYFKYKAQGSLIAKLNQHLRLQEETVLRTLTVHAEEPRRNSARSNPAKAAAKPAATATAAAQ